MELAVERALGPEGPSGGVARLSARFEIGPDGDGPTPSELAKELEQLIADLSALLGPPIAAAPVARPDRDLTELIETYRPRQRELVDLLRDEGELTSTEHARLGEYLAGRRDESGTTRPPLDVMADRPIAAMPIAADRTSAPSRSVPELLRSYQIASLKQAGAVRARRQISFAEYMALKRYFQDQEERSGGRPAERVA